VYPGFNLDDQLPTTDFAPFGLHVISCKLRVEVHVVTGAPHVNPFESRVGQLRQYPYPTESMFATAGRIGRRPSPDSCL
jgi:hypothetical protein